MPERARQPPADVLETQCNEDVETGDDGVKITGFWVQTRQPGDSQKTDDDLYQHPLMKSPRFPGFPESAHRTPGCKGEYNGCDPVEFGCAPGAPTMFRKFFKHFSQGKALVSTAGADALDLVPIDGGNDPSIDSTHQGWNGDTGLGPPSACHSVLTVALGVGGEETEKVDGTDGVEL